MKTEEQSGQTIDRARIISALVNATQLRVEHGSGVVLVIGGERFAHVEPLIDDVSIALMLPRESVEQALREAVQQQQLSVPVDLPISEHALRYVRPNTL